jgi:uncharacterized protein (UPF0264 family)
MRLLVSVRNGDEARIAVEAGADIIDAKEPAQGVLGAVDAETLRAIGVAVAQRRPLSAALGDFREGSSSVSIARAARAAADASVRFVKVGIDCARLDVLANDCVHLLEALQGEMTAGTHCDVVLGVFADASQHREGAMQSVIDVAIGTRPMGEHCRITGVLLDTLSKDGRTLFDFMAVDRIATWVKTAHEAELFVALAGSLAADHVGMARDTGADIMGVRGAACEGGRSGCLSADRVRGLARAILP